MSRAQPPLGSVKSGGASATYGSDAIGGVVDFVVPTYRPDCERETDLVEEVARHHGYNNIARTLPRTKEPSGGLTPAASSGGIGVSVLVFCRTR